MPVDLWSTIHTERAALADDLADLPEPAWATRSLCPEWTVVQVLGHMTATAQMTPGRFIGKLARAGFRFPVMVARDVAEQTAGPPSRTLAEFRNHVGDSTAPPGPTDSWLGETIVHATDIRWPLGLAHRFPNEAVVQVAEFYRKSNALIGARRRITGLTLRATDTDWSTGTGPEVSGPILALVMAMTGRSAAHDQLTGSGLTALTARA